MPCGCGRICQCWFTSDDCISVAGRGTQVLDVIPDEDYGVNNLLECNPSGLGVFLPDVIKNPPTCRVFSSVHQTIPDNVNYPLLFNRERFDSHSMHNIINDISRITFYTAGVYVITFNVQWNGDDEGDRKILVRLNTAEIIVSDERGSEEGDNFDQSVMTIWKMEANDFIEAMVAQNTGSGLAIRAEGNYSPEFAASYVAVG